MIGFFCNILLLYYYGDRKVIIADASRWALDKHHRVKILQLSDAFFCQDGADILLATTANAAAGRIFERYGASQIPQPLYDQILYWILNGSGFVSAALRTKKLSAATSNFISGKLEPIIKLGLAANRRKFPYSTRKVDLINVNQIGDEFDELWRKKMVEAKKLLACRSAAYLRWHFSEPLGSSDVKILIARETRLRGYLALMRDDRQNIGLKRMRIADLFVENDEAPVVESLLAAAHEYSSQQGCHVLEWMGMPANLRDIALRYRPFKRLLPTWPLFFKTINPSLEKVLSNEKSWYVTPYDGDTTLF